MIRPRPFLALGTLVLAACPGPGAPPPAEATNPESTESEPRRFLRELVDDFGGRLAGTPQSHAARARLLEELRALGLEPLEEPFQIPGWSRGEDRVAMLTPQHRALRVAALSGSEAHPPFEAAVVDLGRGGTEDYPAATPLAGKIGLIAPNARLRTPQLVDLAAREGMRALLYINRVGGGQLLARSGNFTGEPLPLPMYSITQEEGFRLQRLLAQGSPVHLRVETRSTNHPIEAANVILRFPGRTPGTIVVGAHFDSWDLGQGAIDNGLGIAQLYALARALRGEELEHSVEIVWFDAEEVGLWGSRHRAEASREDPLIAMFNLDMAGVPIGVNALGADSLVPALERWHTSLATPLERGVENLNWMASDHTPYQLAGVRSLTFNAPIRQESVRYYHDFADTWDKVHPGLIEDSAAAVISLVKTLANDPALAPTRMDPATIRESFARFNLLPRLEASDLSLPDAGPAAPAP